jgi:hypothetical protein
MVSGQRRRDNHGGAAEPNRRTFGVEVDQRRQHMWVACRQAKRTNALLHRRGSYSQCDRLCFLGGVLPSLASNDA